MAGFYAPIYDSLFSADVLSPEITSKLIANVKKTLTCSIVFC